MKKEIGRRITSIRNNLGMNKNQFAAFLRCYSAIPMFY